MRAHSRRVRDSVRFLVLLGGLFLLPLGLVSRLLEGIIELVFGITDADRGGNRPSEDAPDAAAAAAQEQYADDDTDDQHRVVHFLGLLVSVVIVVIAFAFFALAA